MLYLISYDLNAPGRQYQPLYDALHALNARAALDSSWVVEHNNNNTSCQQLFEHLRPHLDTNDDLLVCAVSAWWATGRVVKTIHNEAQ